MSPQQQEQVRQVLDALIEKQRADALGQKQQANPSNWLEDAERATKKLEELTRSAEALAERLGQAAGEGQRARLREVKARLAMKAGELESTLETRQDGLAVGDQVQVQRCQDLIQRLQAVKKRLK